MASRILHSGPSKPSAGDKRTQSALPRPSVSKQSSSSATPTTGSTSSRLPTSAGSSLFGRSRAKTKEKERPVERRASNLVSIQSARPSAVDSALSSKPATGRTSMSPEALRSSPPPASEPSRGLQPGMGVTTEITGGHAASDRPQPVRSLRRKASLTGAHDKYTSSETSEAGGDSRSAPSLEPTNSPGGQDPFPGSIFGITVSPPSAAASTYTPISRPDYTTPTEFQTSNSRMELYMSRKQLPHKLSTQNLPPPTPNYASTASAQDMSSASSRFTSTPSPFSRISTPNTSASSYSPAVPITPKLTPPRTRPSQSPTRSSRPPVSLRSRKLPASTPVEESSSRGGLPSVRETSTGNQSSSSSSNSTIKASEMIDQRTGRAVIRPPRIDSKPAPLAPLRISSRRLPRPPLANTSGTNELEDETVDARASVISEPRYQSRLPPAGFSSGVRSPPPSRPSREGTPHLPSLKPSESPVIQSNLSHLATTGHTRRESIENAAALADRSDTASPRRKLAKTPPQGAATVTSPHLYPTRGQSKNREIPSLVSDAPRPSKRDPSPASTSSVSSRSRFGLFTRKTKIPDEPMPSASRKGPSAGTGHEAYGKFGRPSRGRSGSQSSTGSRDKSVGSSVSAASERSTSAGGAASKKRQSSFASNDGIQPNLNDDFLSQRLQPVVISGGGNIKNNRNSAIGGVPMYASSSAQSSNASFASSSEGFSKKAGVTSSESSTSMISTAPSDKRVSRSLLPAPKLTPSRTIGGQRTLAHRRSQQRISHGDQNVRIPAPINTQAPASKLVLDTNDTMQSSVLETGSTPQTGDMAEGVWLKSGDAKEQRKKSRSPRRWNLFSRTRSRSPKKSTPVSAAEPMPQLTPAMVEESQASANVTDLQRAKFGGHYAMLDDEATDDDARSMDNVLRDIEDELDLRDEEGAIVPGTMEEEAPAPRKVSMLLPSPPKLHAEFPRLEPTPPRESEVERHEPALERRPSRLQRVGRIPTSHAHKPSQGSFSRPFQSDNRPSLEDNRPPAVVEEEAEPSIHRPRLALQTDRLPTTTAVEQWRQATYAPAPPTNAFLHNLDGEQEFLTIPTERQTSQVTTSSTGTGTTAFMNMLAKRPSRDDEVWNEYDDLLENNGPLFSLGSPEGEQMLSAFPAAPSSRSPSEKTEAPRSFSRQSTHSRKSSSPPVPDKPDYLVVPPQLHPDTNRLTAKNTLSDIYSDYNTRNSSTKAHDENNPLPNPRRGSNASTLTSRYSSQTTISSSSHVSTYTPSPVNSVTRAMARKTHSTRDSLRFSALMTSRWLSFDRVLFSPVAEDILSLAIPTPRILVLDGLANDDWSAYTALSYPSATVYNLSTTPKLRALSPHGAEYSNPPNHKLLPLPSMAHPFPFPKGFFTAVVLRFPPLLPQHHLANIIGEAKRVLRPGGFLEMTLLDIDPVNLGPKTRRQVKRVKVRAQERMPDAGLAPVADTAMKLLARRQFEGLRHAVLGVPVASTPDSNAIQGPGPLPFNEERVSGPGPGTETENNDGEPRPPRSLGDLLREAGEDSAPGLAAQYPVAQTIGRVARWWWSRCYEGLASVDGNDERGTLLGLRGRGEEDGRSMWADPEVMRECEERETGLRLVLAYAVKPMVVRRRTVSV